MQDDAFALLDSATLLLISNDVRDSPLMRIALHPTPENGLSRPSQVMIDKTMTVPPVKLGQTIGRADTRTMKSVDDALSRFLGLAR